MADKIKGKGVISGIAIGNILLAGMPAPITYPGLVERYRFTWAETLREGLLPDIVLSSKLGSADPEMTARVLEAVCRSGAAVPAILVKDTIKMVSVGKNGETVVATPERSRLRAVQTPQSFDYARILDAHLRAQADGLGDFIDSVSMMSHYGYQIHTVEGPSENIKVTTPMDYFAFKGYMEARDQRMLWGDVQ